jgi:hypothetical protein
MRCSRASEMVHNAFTSMRKRVGSCFIKSPSSSCADIKPVLGAPPGEIERPMYKIVSVSLFKKRPNPPSYAPPKLRPRRGRSSQTRAGGSGEFVLHSCRLDTVRAGESFEMQIMRSKMLLTCLGWVSRGRIISLSILSMSTMRLSSSSSLSTSGI